MSDPSFDMLSIARKGLASRHVRLGDDAPPRDRQCGDREC